MFPDAFDPEFEKTARRVAGQRCAPRTNDRCLLGWFSDNELRWGPDWRGGDELLTLFLALPADSGLPNTRGAGPIVKTQADRAAAFVRYATWALSKPNLVGYHWFEPADEPREGRFDVENSNYGVVDIQDEPHKILTQAMTRLNAQAEKPHEKP